MEALHTALKISQLEFVSGIVAQLLLFSMQYTWCMQSQHKTMLDRASMAKQCNTDSNCKVDSTAQHSAAQRSAAQHSTISHGPTWWTLMNAIFPHQVLICVFFSADLLNHLGK